MDIISQKITEYAEAHTTPESEALQNLNRETNAKVLMPRMLSGHLQGRVLSMFSHMIRPKRILEIGTYTGYSAICLSEGLVEGGILHTIDINEELKPMALNYFKLSGCEQKIILHTGNALQVVPSLNETWDIVFIDADKKNYSAYYDMVLPHMRKGGFIIADNVLWSGKVLDNPADMDTDTRAISDFNKKVVSDPRVENVLLPIRDGLLIARTK
jgi:caffeoyl-CoA O-methyltransferase